MKYLTGVGLGLSLVFGCLLLALIAEVYYLLWWKNRIIKRSNEDGYHTSKFFHKFCCKKPSSASTPGAAAQELHFSETFVQTHQSQQLHVNSNNNKKDLQFRPLGIEDGMPRFLFTIEEETREDLESENGRSSFDNSRKQSRSKSLSDLLLHGIAETPFLTPATSPPYYTPPLTPSSPSSDNYYNHNQKGSFNPFLESESDAVFNRLRSSPPPKLRFLKDAEDKLYRRKVMEEVVSIQNNSYEGQYIPSTSQVLPMASSPPIFNSKTHNLEPLS